MRRTSPAAIFQRPSTKTFVFIHSATSGIECRNRTLEKIPQEGFFILGWVAMWRPLQIFLYDWWPVLHYRRLYGRLAAMPVKVVAFDSA
jgi:hypothetical protein